MQEISISEERKEVLKKLIDYIKNKRSQQQEVHLNFICTHNSRRSQFSQVWAQTVAAFYGISVKCYSGGVEVTACNERTIAALKENGFAIEVEKESTDNPMYLAMYSEGAEPIQLFSKVFDDPVNESKTFAAIMTCSHADENCPFIPGTEQRIPIRYEDPKTFDNTALEREKYRACSLTIGAEMCYVFSNIT